MKLQILDFYLNWHKSIKVIYLREFIMSNLTKKGRVIRWSIVDIKDSVNSLNTKRLRINAVLADRNNSSL